jgi:hypothetical protein
MKASAFRDHSFATTNFMYRNRKISRRNLPCGWKKNHVKRCYREHIHVSYKFRLQISIFLEITWTVTTAIILAQALQHSNRYLARV